MVDRLRDIGLRTAIDLEHNQWIALDILEPRVIRCAGFEPQLAPWFYVPDVC